jgi:methylthioribose-1-phosphate isomerase
MEFTTIEWKNDRAIIIDQTKLPIEEKYLEITNYREMAKAIKQLKIRGAPAIGIAGAFGVCLAAQEISSTYTAVFSDRLHKIIDEFAATRPTAVNLFWALDRMKNIITSHIGETPQEIRKRLLAEAKNIHDEDRETCRLMGEHGATLLKDGDTVLTHCNAGALATGGIGTALGVIFTAANQGKKIRVFADETRPLLQGARLTTWELMKAGIDVTLICDNMAAWVMQQGWIDCVMVGADRIAANGDAANKIGTYNLAVLANHHKIPFYVIAPKSTFDLTITSGEEIPIEQRSREEVTQGFGKRTAPAGVTVYNPAFDVTPGDLISGIVSEEGVFAPPFSFIKS